MHYVDIHPTFAILAMRKCYVYSLKVGCDQGPYYVSFFVSVHLKCVSVRCMNDLAMRFGTVMMMIAKAYYLSLLALPHVRMEIVQV